MNNLEKFYVDFIDDLRRRPRGRRRGRIRHSQAGCHALARRRGGQGREDPGRGEGEVTGGSERGQEQAAGDRDGGQRALAAHDRGIEARGVDAAPGAFGDAEAPGEARDDVRHQADGGGGPQEQAGGKDQAGGRHEGSDSDDQGGTGREAAGDRQAVEGGGRDAIAHGGREDRVRGAHVAASQVRAGGGGGD